MAPFAQGWITLAPDGGIWVHTEGRDQRAAEAGDVQEPVREHVDQAVLAIHAAEDGPAVIVVNDDGRTGVVLDLSTGATTLRLDRGTYHPEQTRSPRRP